MSDSALACPLCGAPDQPTPTTPVVRCRACNAPLFVEDAPTPHVMIEPKLDAAAALARATSWMHGPRHREFLAWRATIDAPRLVYLPFTSVEASVVGVIYGKRKHVEDKRTYYTDEELEVAEELLTSEPLSAAGELGVERLPDLGPATQRPFDAAAIAERQAESVPALATETTATELAHRDFLARVHKKYKLDSVTGEVLSVIGARETTVHYPYWRLDYRAGKLSYIVMVDASSGAIAYGRAPGSMLFHSAFYALVMPLAALVMLVATIIAIVIFGVGADVSDASSKVGGAIYGVGALVGAAGIGFGGWIATVAHRGLKRAGEIEGGYGAHAGADLFDTNDADYVVDRAREQAEVDADLDLARLETAT